MRGQPPAMCGPTSRVKCVAGPLFWASHGLALFDVNVLADFLAMPCGRSAGWSSAELSCRGVRVMRKSSWPFGWW
jgi:hypothetical protein